MKKEIKEQIEIVINETDNNSEKIKDISFTLNTGLESVVSFTTEKINGILESVIIDAEKPINIHISLNEHPNVTLFDVLGFIGEKYLPLQQEPTSSDNQKLNFGTVKWILNDSLKITINGNINTLVHFTFRYR